jgi:hypothetical protein
MLESERDDFLVVLRHLHSAYGKKVSIDTAEMWFNVMRRRFVPLATFRKAVVLAVEAERMLPRVALMLQYCDRAREAVERKALPAGPVIPDEPCGQCADTGWQPFFCAGREQPDPDGAARENVRAYEVRTCQRRMAGSRRASVEKRIARIRRTTGPCARMRAPRLSFPGDEVSTFSSGVLAEACPASWV